MASKVEIVNRALQKLGASTIVSLSDNSVNARAANLSYEPVKLMELRKHTWNFATKTFSLAADATAPDFEYSYSYTLPSDWIMLVAPYPNMKSEDLDWQVQGGKIYTNDSAPLQGRYIWDVQDPNLMDALFREALSCSLANELCELLTQSNSKQATVAAMYKETINMAKRQNAIEKPPVTFPDDKWITARR